MVTKTEKGLIEQIEEAAALLSSIKDKLPEAIQEDVATFSEFLLNREPKQDLTDEEIEELIDCLEEIRAEIEEEADYGEVPADRVKKTLADLLALLTSQLKSSGKYGYRYTEPYAVYNTEQPQSAYKSPRQDLPAKPSKIYAAAKLTEAVEGANGKAWEAILIEAGMSANRRYYPIETLRKSYQLFEGVKAYIDHKVDSGSIQTTNRSIRDIAGWFENVRCTERGIEGCFVVNEGQDWLRSMLKTAYERGKDDLVGFSIVAEGRTRIDRDNTGPFLFVESLDRVFSVDLVTEPAAGGRLASLIESKDQEVKELKMLDSMTKEELQALRPDLFVTVADGTASKIREALDILNESKPELPAAVIVMMERLDKMACSDPVKRIKEDIGVEVLSWALSEAGMSDKTVNAVKAALKVLFAVKDELPANISSLLDKLYKLVYPEPKKEEVNMDKLTELEKKIALSESRAILTESLATSDLPEPVKEKIRKRFADKIFEKSELEAVITEEKEVLGKLVESTDSPYVPRVRHMVSETDKISKALTGMLLGEAVDGIQPFKSLRQAYATYKGISVADIDPTKILAESVGYSSVNRQVLTESIETGSWAELLGDSITRAMIKEYSLPALDDWKKVCSEIGSVNDFRTQRRVRMGGYGTLPEVEEGKNYEALVSPTDEEVTWAPVKRGGLEDLTLEAIANDDLGAVRRIPRALARAAKVTLFRFVFDLVADGGAYSSQRDNMSDDPLGDEGLTIGKQKMRKKTAYGTTTEYLQLAPKYLLVPTNLEATAKKLETGEYALRVVTTAGSTAVGHPTEINIHRNTFETIVVDYWTDENAWYLVADPRLAPTIEIGFLGGRQEPELLTQDQPTVGSVFTADKISYKIRHVYGGVMLDWRSFFRGGK